MKIVKRKKSLWKVSFLAPRGEKNELGFLGNARIAGGKREGKCLGKNNEGGGPRKKEGRIRNLNIGGQGSRV